MQWSSLLIDKNMVKLKYLFACITWKQSPLIKATSRQCYTKPGGTERHVRVRRALKDSVFVRKQESV